MLKKIIKIMKVINDHKEELRREKNRQEKWNKFFQNNGQW